MMRLQDNIIKQWNKMPKFGKGYTKVSNFVKIFNRNNLGVNNVYEYKDLILTEIKSYKHKYVLDKVKHAFAQFKLFGNDVEIDIISKETMLTNTQLRKIRYIAIRGTETDQELLFECKWTLSSIVDLIKARRKLEKGRKK